MAEIKWPNGMRQDIVQLSFFITILSPDDFVGEISELHNTEFS